LINPKPKVSGSTPEIRKSKQIFIDLKKIQPIHEEWYEKASEKGRWTAMAFSSLCNGYIQDNKPWDLAKTDLARCG
jgi:methionyl-tRNA synthetase